MKKTLIITNRLAIGGAEKLTYELAIFSKRNLIEPIILILDNYNAEYYEDLFVQNKINVVRTKLSNIKNIRSPKRMLKSLLWLFKLKYFADYYYQSVQVIGLYNVEKVWDIVRHKKRFFWNVNNAAQYENRVYPVNDKIFSNASDYLININQYQMNELEEQFGKCSIKTKTIDFKLFINDSY